MNIGDLRHRVEIGRYVGAIDETTGDPIGRQWQRVAIVWAAVEALTGRLYFEAQLTAQQSDHRVTIRYRPGIEPGMVVRHNGRELVIHAVLDRDGTKRWLQLLAQEVRPA